MQKGKIIPNGVYLEKHEYDTILFLTELGFDIELVPKSNIMGVHSPDIKINQDLWEIKSPKGEGKSLMKNTLQRGARQSQNIIVDLKRAKRFQDKCLVELEKEFYISKHLKKMKVITKSRKILDFIKK